MKLFAKCNVPGVAPPPTDSKEQRGAVILGGAMDMPEVWVLVINWNGRQHLEECFASLLEQTYPKARYVLIDNASTDDSVEFVERRFGSDPCVEIIRCDDNLGWSRGNNVGLERALAAEADYALLLNNDTVVAADALERLVDAAQRNPRIGALAPKMLLYDDSSLINSLGLECSVIGCSWDLGIGRLDGAKWDEPRPVIGACGGACLLRVSALRKSGLLPTDYDIYLDDLDLCLRIWNADYEIWNCPSAVVRHKFSATMGLPERERRKYFLNTRNRMRTVLRNFPAGRFAQVVPALAIGEMRAVGRAFLDREPWRVAAHAWSWADAIQYTRTACCERRRNKARGLDRHRFWHLIEKKRLFFQGVELPEDGWYAPREVRGAQLSPISSKARQQVKAGKLRVRYANCYPQLGPTEIRVDLDGTPVATLCTSGVEETVIDLREGLLEFTAARIFDADQTGELADFGGWIAIEPV